MLFRSPRNLIISGGMTKNFEPIGSSLKFCNYTDTSCATDLSDTLQHVSQFAIFIPLTKPMDCNHPLTSLEIDLDIYGVNGDFDLTRKLTCNNMDECLKIACQMYNNEQKVMWILFTNFRIS